MIPSHPLMSPGFNKLAICPKPRLLRKILLYIGQEKNTIPHFQDTCVCIWIKQQVYSYLYQNIITYISETSHLEGAYFSSEEWLSSPASDRDSFSSLLSESGFFSSLSEMRQQYKLHPTVWLKSCCTESRFHLVNVQSMQTVWKIRMIMTWFTPLCTTL